MSWLDQAVAAAAASQPVPIERVYPDKVPGRVLLVDGDYLAYYCAGNEETSSGTARKRAIERLETMRDLSGSTKIVIHMTSEASTKGDRFIVAQVKPYQGHRQGGRRPKNWQYLRDWMQAAASGLFTTKTWGDREADDGLAYHAQVLGIDKAVIATGDKDLRMVPCWHLDWRQWTMTRLENEFAVTGDNGLLYGTKWFWQQLLQGDTADGIPGLPAAIINGKRIQVGETRATNWLADATSDDEALVVVGGLYRTLYQDEWPTYLMEQMSLLWMRRDTAAEVDSVVPWLNEVITWGDALDALNEAGMALADRVAQEKALYA